MKKYIKFLFLFLILFTISACSKAKNEELIIIYTNDIHSYIGNYEKVNNEKVPSLRLSHVKGYVDDLKKDNKNVLLVDAGDEIQGTIYGGNDQGHSIIDIMNETGYDLATPGNHDFDFGMDTFNYLVENANYPYISCNFRTLPEHENVLDSYKILEVGDYKVGFVGISTPETIISSTPTYFQDEFGNYIYEFVGMDDPTKLYDLVQNAVDEIKDEVDYVIALGHAGVGYDEEKVGISSENIINNTTGIDAFIGGHSHTEIENRIVKNKDDKDCVLTQTGSYLTHFGQMKIKNGKISTKLINDNSKVDNDVKALEDALIANIDELMGQKVSATEKKLYITNPSVEGQRIIRSRETNLANLVSDSVYWYLNDYKLLDCDIALVNGGGIRQEIKAGDITLQNINDVEPFGNQVCLIKTKGINIKNAIELGANVIGEWDSKDNRPAENGGFLHIAGMTYDIDASKESTVTLDGKGNFVSVAGEYKVSNLKIYNKTTKAYEDLDENKEYLVAGINYILRNGGNGMTMFNSSENVLDYIAEDYLVLADYMKAFNNNIINNANSPLNKYDNYLFDYENPLGSGRINILNLL